MPEIPFRVAYLVNQYPSVSHAFIRREIRALERSGVEVHRMSIRGWDAPLVDSDDLAEREVTRYLLRDGLWALAKSTLTMAVRRPRAVLKAGRAAFAMGRGALRPLPYHLIYLAEASRMAGWVEAAGVRHVHAHFSTNSAEVARLTHILTGVPYSFTAHGPAEADHGARLHLPAKVKDARFVAAVSSFTRALVLRHLPVDAWDKVQIVRCGLNDTAFGDPPAASDPVFLCVGRLVAVKAHLLLVEAFAQVLGDHPKARLMLAGDGEMRGPIEERIKTLGIDHAVRITGWISADQVRAELDAARAFVLPSFLEGLPVVIMEAMARRRPVISTYVAGIPELVRPGETGWLVPAGDIDALSEAMRDCLEADASQLANMGEAAQICVRERHLIDTEAQRLARLMGADPIVSLADHRLGAKGD